MGISIEGTVKFTNKDFDLNQHSILSCTQDGAVLLEMYRKLYTLAY